MANVFTLLIFSINFFFLAFVSITSYIQKVLLYPDNMPVELKPVSDEIMLVTLTDESATNAFDPEFMSELDVKIRQIIEDEKIRAFILTGTEKFFCAGANINEFRKHYDKGTIGKWIKQMTDILHPLILKIRHSDTIMIAAVNGAAAGAGLGLALSADYRIASSGGKFAASYFSLGLSPDGGTSWLLPRLVGSQKTRIFFFENQVWSAEECLEYGAIDELVDETILIQKSIEIANKWGSWSKASRSSKDLLDFQENNDLETHLKLEQRRIIDAGFTSDFSEGVDAFLEKRKANFN
ncbi:MAG: hypothetical protein CMA03_05125 [Euryarchaeota archaeon]|nr:hypothetical protein [Euryarchaeota archaeon]|tara:strand:+ start:233 stop:1117 length:885 start_codon:yes stop_codon:yes gene_type:complete